MTERRKLTLIAVDTDERGCCFGGGGVRMFVTLPYDKEGRPIVDDEGKRQIQALLERPRHP